jgi:hypothetical protein
LNLCGLPHLIPLFESQEVIPEQLEFISNNALKRLKVELIDRKQFLYHFDMLIGNEFQDENHKEKCAICRCPVEELLKEFSIKLNLEKVKELKLKAYHLMYFTDAEIACTFEIGKLQAGPVVKSLQVGKSCTKKLSNKIHHQSIRSTDLYTSSSN